MTHPIVVVYDNDDGAKGIRNSIKQASRQQVTGKEPFVRVTKNMYAVSTPNAVGRDASSIEDFFDAKTKETTLDGKTFNSGDNFDSEKNYGKTVFAHKVVRSKAETIDFGGFRPLLTNIVAVMDHHRAMVTASGPSASQTGGESPAGPVQ